MSARVSPTERIRADIDALFTGDRDLFEVLEEVARLGARLIIQTAVEAEVSEFLGRARYERAASTEDARAGMRNGYCPTTVRTTSTAADLSRVGGPRGSLRGWVDRRSAATASSDRS